MVTSAANAPNAALLRAMPALFVLIWSTGFVVARYGMPHAPPFTFLAWRYAISVLAFVAWILLARAEWPRRRSLWLHLAVTGCLMHAGYLGGVWAAVKAGLGAGTVALVVGLQPLLTALWLAGAGPAHRIALRQWFGLGLGLLGLLLVVWHRLEQGEVRSDNLAMAIFALLSITAGTLYQKRFVEPCDVRSAGCVQMLAALLVTAPLALLETEAMSWHPQLIGAMVWSVLVLTLGGSSLLYLLIQRGAATRVTSLMYLVPPSTAMLAWWLFAERITALVVAGMVLTAIAVAMVVRDGSGTARDAA